MLRLLFVSITMMLLGLGSGYFLWGGRAARLTESINGLTLEIDTMRERLARPQAPPPQDGARAADELRVINEAVAAMRLELASQKEVLERTAATAVPADSATISAELRTVRDELATCIADKRDLQMRGSAPGAQTAPAYTAPAPAYRPAPPAPATPPAPPPGGPLGHDLSDPRF